MATRKQPADASVQTWPLKITGAGEDVPRHLLAFGPGCGGTVMYRATPPTGNAAMVLATREGKVEKAKVWSTDLGLAPSHHPELPKPIEAAVKMMVALKDGIPAPGPMVLKGTWSGRLVCNDGKMHVELARKVVSYGQLTIVSGPDGRWTAKFTREARWFTKGAEQQVQRSGLAEAITAGMGLVIGLVSEACSVRDTSRRGALDAEHAAKHPVKPPKAPKDTTEKYVAKRLQLPTLDEVKVEEPCPTCVDGLVNAAGVIRMQAGKLKGGIQKINRLDDAPAQLGRAAKLLKRANALLRSPLCQGPEQKAGLDAVREATAAFARARKGLAALDDKRRAKALAMSSDSGAWTWDDATAKDLVRAVEHTALAAARVSKSCSTGQQKLAVGKPAKAPSKAAKKVAAKVKAAKAPPPVTPPAPTTTRRTSSTGTPVTAPGSTVTMQPVWPPAAPPQAVRVARAKPSRQAPGDGSKRGRGTATGKAADKLILGAVKTGMKELAAELRAGQ